MFVLFLWKKGLSRIHFKINVCATPRFVNPRLMWCYTGEDLMGKMRPACSSATRGNSMWGMAEKSCEKYMRALDMSLRHAEELEEKYMLCVCVCVQSLDIAFFTPPTTQLQLEPKPGATTLSFKKCVGAFGVCGGGGGGTGAALGFRLQLSWLAVFSTYIVQSLAHMVQPLAHMVQSLRQSYIFLR